MKPRPRRPRPPAPDPDLAHAARVAAREEMERRVAVWRRAAERRRAASPEA